MRVAIVHDFLIEYGGAERVLEALHEIYPNAPVYVAFYNRESLGKQAHRFDGWDIKVSWGRYLPFWKSLVSPYRIFSKSFFESFDLSSYDLVISSSNAYMAKAVKASGGKHVCYCHTPPRFLYGYSTATNWKNNPVLRVIGEIINHVMRVWDFETAQKVDFFIANSQEVRGRIKKFYRRDSEVIYPPVNTDKFKVSNDDGKYFLVVSRLVASKNVDIAVEACTNLKLPLKVVGVGKDLAKLQQKAGKSVEFLGDLNDEELIDVYKSAKALIFPASQEDFGIVPVEAMASGKPVIALNEGGVRETVVDKATGLFFEKPEVGSLTDAIGVFLKMDRENKWDPKAIRKHAEGFSKEKFKKEFVDFIKKHVNKN